MKVNYKQMKERINAVLSENGEKLNSDEGAAAAFTALLSTLKLKQWYILNDLYDFALEYGVSTDYLLGLSDEMY